MYHCGSATDVINLVVTLPHLIMTNTVSTSNVFIMYHCVSATYVINLVVTLPHLIMTNSWYQHEVYLWSLLLFISHSHALSY